MTNGERAIAGHSAFVIRHFKFVTLHNLGHTCSIHHLITPPLPITGQFGSSRSRSIVAAVIDGLKLKVPNWITFPMIISGWIYSATLSPYAGWEGLMYSLLGTFVGLGCSCPPTRSAAWARAT